MSAALFFGIAGCAVAPHAPEALARGDYDAVKTYLASRARHEMEADRITGLSIAIIDDQRVVWAQGFGFADKERQVPATADTLYRAGSISKLFTATAAMQLAEQGRLDIDQPLQRVLPGFSIRSRFADATAITPRQLMTHHAGLPRDVSNGMFSATPRPFTDIVSLLRDSDMAYRPDTLLSYSNVGVSLLGVAIQQISGESFANHMQHALLEPLGMTNSAFEAGVSDSPLMAKAYRRGTAVPELALRDVPAGGLNSSVTDLGRFLSMVFADGRVGDRQILQPKTLAEMLRAQNEAVPLDFDARIGLGWFIDPSASGVRAEVGPVISHGGATLMHRAQVVALPLHKLAVIVMSNSANGGELAVPLAREALALSLQAKTGIKMLDNKPQAQEPQPWSGPSLDLFAGDYTTVAGFVRVHSRGKTLQADAMGRKFDVVPRGSDQLGLRYSLLGFIPVKLGSLDEIRLLRRHVADRDVLVVRQQGHELLAGERVPESSNASAWEQRVGVYEAEDADGFRFFGEVRLVKDQNALVLEVTPADESGPPRRLATRVLSDDEALLLGSLSDGGETVRSVMHKGEERLQFSGYRWKRIERR